MRKGVPIPVTGKLDKDSDPLYIKPGNYSDLKGMDFSEEDVLTLTTQKGNVKVIDFGSVSLQQQKTRINLPGPYADPVTVTMLDIQRNIKVTGTQVTGGTLQGTKDAISSVLSSSPYNILIDNPTTLDAYLDVQIGFAYSDYILEVTGATTDILLEAISNTGVGRYMPIGSYDLLDDIFYWLTTQRNLQSQLPLITNAYASVNGQVGIQFFESHGLSNFDSIAVGSVVGVPQANGIYTVTVINANNVFLNTTAFSGTYTGGGVAFKDIYGYGCIGVVVEDELNDTFNFTPLLRSKKLNFVTKKQIYTPQIQTNSGVIQMYYCDDYNNARVTYYRGEYEDDGAITVLHAQGQYAYATLNIEINLQVNFSGYEFTFYDQIQSLGNVTAGNARYAFRFLTQSLTPSELSFLTPSIPVFSPPYSDTDSTGVIYGNPSTVSTGKINRLLVTGFLPGVFKYIELIYFQYLGASTTVSTNAFIIRQEQLGENQTEIILEHNGNEPNIRFFDYQLANEVQPSITRAANNLIKQIRLFLFKPSLGTEIDCTEWFKGLKYSIQKRDVYGAYGAETHFEFYNPDTVVDSVGYQIYEWYRFTATPILKTGKTLNSFFAFDMRFVTQADYIANSDFQFIETNETDRRDFSADTFTEYNLGDLQRNLFQYGILVSGLDWNFQIDGVPVRDLFSEVRIGRVERVPEVLASGVWAGSVNMPELAPAIRLRDFQYSIANNFAGNDGTDYVSSTEITVNRRFGSFYSPQIFFNRALITHVPGDKLISFGSFYTKEINAATSSSAAVSTRRIFFGNTGTQSANIYGVDSYTFVNSNTLTVVDTNTSYDKQGAGEIFNVSYPYGREQASPVLKLDVNVLNSGVNDDKGLYSSLYFRERKEKYGATTSNNLVLYTGYRMLLEESSVFVLGGDVFTQNTWLKKKYYRDTGNGGGAEGFNLISQNTINTNLRLYNSNLTNNALYPVSTTNYLDWLENLPQYDDQIAQNPAYDILNNVQYIVVYNPEGQYSGVYLSRTIYSDFKPNGSFVDFMRTILPGNYQDSPERQGGIMMGVNLNEALFILQQRGFTMAYVNSQGSLVSGDTGQVLIGDGSVLQRIGTNLSEFGLKQSGAFVKGKSQSGKDTAMWVNTTFTNVLRFGDDGIRNVSLRDSVRTFFNKNLRWANNANTPADGFGITGVWDNANSQYVFTVKAWKPYSKWSKTAPYNEGAGVLSGFISQGVPQIWIALQGNIASKPTHDNPKWKAIDIEDNLYYNCFTFVYSEIKNGFTFYPYFLPNFYSQWKGRFLTAHPDLESINKSELYLHGDGEPNTFYDVQYNGGEITLTLNWQPNLNKKLIALHINSNVKPERVDILSLFRDNINGETIKESFLVASDFETREGYQYAPVKLQIDANGSNEGDSSSMEGVWSKFIITFPKGVKCKLNDSIVFISDSTRNFTQ